MLRLLLNELKREWILMSRYATETISMIVGLIVPFYGLFLGIHYIAGSGVQFGDRLDSIIVGYVLWSLSMGVIGDVAIEIQQEAQKGILEQIFLSHFGALTIFIIRAIANLIIQIVLNIGILTIIIVLTQSHLFFPITILFPFTIVVIGAYSMALIIGSLALLFKRTQQMLGIFRFLLFFLMMIPIETMTGFNKVLSWLLPMTPGVGILRELMARGQALDSAQIFTALISSILYFVFGLFLFQFAERKVKQNGKIGGY